MKFNQWTLGLAAVGVISLASAARAEEGAVPLLTALSATTISGYVDTSAQWNLGTGNEYNPNYKFGGPAKADGFNLNVVQLSIAKPLDESEWAAGYKVDLWFGPDANTLRTASAMSGDVGRENTDFAIRQAYVALRAPVGNGLDFKVGVFDSIIGYESVESGNNPNMTRSYGHGIEPQTMTGVLATYRFSECFSAAVGVANTVGPSINNRAFDTGIDWASPDKAESYKTYMGSIALTAPESWGCLAGSTLYAGVVNGFNYDENDWAGSDIYENTTSWYVGATIATPVTGLRLGAAFDYLDVHNWGSSYDNAWAVAGYASYQATEKLSLHARGEYFEDKTGDFGVPGKVVALTGTIQYDLWQNVITRAEVRWDHAAGHHTEYGMDGDLKNAVMIAFNVIYKL